MCNFQRPGKDQPQLVESEDSPALESEPLTLVGKLLRSLSLLFVSQGLCSVHLVLKWQNSSLLPVSCLTVH